MVKALNKALPSLYIHLKMTSVFLAQSVRRSTWFLNSTPSAWVQIPQTNVANMETTYRECKIQQIT